jgi:allantoate deiminase
LTLTSGAGHDAMVMASVTPSGLIFVRCAGGVSHNPAESITIEDACLGAEVLLRAVLNLADSVSAV